jgi:hypothetical protein
MENKDKVIGELFTRLEELMRQQAVFQGEIQKIHRELELLKDAGAKPDALPEQKPHGKNSSARTCLTK